MYLCPVMLPSEPATVIQRLPYVFRTFMAFVQRLPNVFQTSMAFGTRWVVVVQPWLVVEKIPIKTCNPGFEPDTALNPFLVFYTYFRRIINSVVLIVIPLTTKKKKKTDKQMTKFSPANFQKMLSPSYIILRIQRLEDQQCRSR